MAVELKHAAGLAYREALPDAGSDRDPVLLIHGYPQSSYMWGPVLEALAAAGRRAIAPDLAGFGDSHPDPPGTWERHVEALERFHRELGLGRVVLGVHDWGGLIGLRWACDQAGAASALILSNTGFFADTEWHSLGRALRTPGQGEQLLDNLTRDAFATIIRDLGGRLSERALDEYWKTFTTQQGRQGLLELFRSGDFDKLAPYEGELGRLEVPALILWGKHDPFVPLAGAERFEDEIADSSLVVLPGASHFLYDDEPDRCAGEIVGFLADKR
jgi:haloalkane dehalogenase